MFDGFRSALGYTFPIVLHKLNFEIILNGIENGKHLPSMHYINQAFSELCHEVPNVSMLDTALAPHYDPNNGHSLFLGDMLHYNSKTNNWVAMEILNNYKSKNSL